MKGISEWVVRHKVWSGVIAFVVIVGVISAATQKSKPKPAAAGVPHAVTTAAPAPSKTPSPSPSPTGPPVSKQAVRWVHRQAHDNNTVQVSIQALGTGIALLQKEGDGISEDDLVAFAQLAMQSDTSLGDVKDDYAVAADGTGDNQTYEEQAFDAVGELADACGTAIHLTDNTVQASDVAKFLDQYQQGVADWDAALTGLYGNAQIPNPPTL